jgi:4-hydroxy-3-methylbut-2-enyl diphosphate reductase
MEIFVAESAGYCYGVERALKQAQKAKQSADQDIFTLGPIIHNPQAVNTLIKQGIIPLDDIGEMNEGILVIRSHGIDPKVIKEAESRGIEVIDATCPFVKKAQQRAAQLVKEGYSVYIVGEKNHPEVVGILAHTDNRAIVIESKQDIPKNIGLKVGVVVQTTQSIENLRAITSYFLEQAVELKVHNTICDATTRRQQDTAKLAREVDVMLVVGGHNSANTARLAEICRFAGVETYQIETAEEIDNSWLLNCEKVGITSGASTPQWLLEDVVKKINSNFAKNGGLFNKKRNIPGLSG